MVYLKKKQSNDDPRTEEELLEHIPAEWPQSVTWLDEDTEPTGLVSEGQTLRHSRVQETENHAQQSSDPVHAPLQSSAAQFGAFGQPWVMLDRPATERTAARTSYEPLGLPEDDLVFADDTSPAFSFYGNPQGTVEGSALQDLLPPDSYVPSQPPYVDPLEQLGSVMSSTPVAFHSDTAVDDAQIQAQLDQFVQAMLGTRQSVDASPTSAFVKYCCKACIFAGQECTSDGSPVAGAVEAREKAIQAVVETFKMIMQHQYEESLNVLGFMVILLDAYGHMKMARSILQRLRRVVVAPTSVSGSLIAGTI